jgi:hypothetical protein
LISPEAKRRDLKISMAPYRALQDRIVAMLAEGRLLFFVSLRRRLCMTELFLQFCFCLF